MAVGRGSAQLELEPDLVAPADDALAPAVRDPVDHAEAAAAGPLRILAQHLRDARPVRRVVDRDAQAGAPALGAQPDGVAGPAAVLDRVRDELAREQRDVGD